MARFKTLDELEVDGKTVLVRVDFNVPMQDGRVGDATRIARSVASIEELAGRGARVVLMSHRGRPEGEPRLIPFTSAAGPLIDLEGGRLVVDPPEEIEAR